MTWYPQGGYMVGWTASMEEAVVEAARRALQGQEVQLRWFEDTTRKKGPTWLVKWRAARQAQGKGRRGKGAPGPSPEGAG